MKTELKPGNTYVFRKRMESRQVYKGIVTDLTKTSVKIRWESGNEIRYLKDRFLDEYDVIEELESDIFELLTQ